MSESITNYGSGVLSVAYVGGSGSMTFVNASAFPNGGRFSITDGEGNIWTVTGVTGDTLSVTLEFGSDVNLLLGSTLTEVVTVRSFEAFLTEESTGLIALLSPFTMVRSIVTGSRAFGTVYQNTTTRPMFVEMNSYNTVGTGATVEAFTDSSNPPTTSITANNDQRPDLYRPLSFWVMPGDYYEITELVSATAVIYTWNEYNVTKP